MPISFGTLFGGRSGRIGPYRFLITGLWLFALKFVIDRYVAIIFFGRGWSLLNYLIPNETYSLLALPRSDQFFYATMLAVAVPFIAIGLLVTLRRLTDAG